MRINKKMDLLVSFDTTGSMYPVLSQVRANVEEFVNKMFKEFSDLRIGIIAHGDYCDHDSRYTIRILDMTRDENKICDFVKNTDATFGGDADECYELVLNSAHKIINWRDDADKLMIMIGDASPHGVYYSMNTDRLDWQEEAQTLAMSGIKVFAVHAMANYRVSSKGFYKSVAKITDGIYLTLNQFNEIINLIKATCYQQSGEEQLNQFISVIHDSGELTISMNDNIRRLKGEEVEDRYTPMTRSSYTRSKRSHSTDEVELKDMKELVPVLPGRFQIMRVDEDCDIKGFVTKNGIEFKRGRGFYELSKAESVQQYKEVIMQDRETGEMFNGLQVREKLGLQPQSTKGGVTERLHKADAEKFRVFVQSTSVNRKLIKGTMFLYEVSDLEDSGTFIDEVDTTKVKLASAKKEVTKKKEVKPKETITAKKERATTQKAKTVVSKNVNPIISKENADKITTYIDKVKEALNRCENSTSKKNKDFLRNNMEKLIKACQNVVDSID